MNNFCSFLVGLLTIACAIHNVSSDRPLDHNYVSILDEKDGEQNYRLPNNTIPETYDITLTTRVDKKDSNFSGTVIIQLIAIESSNSITIHQRQLNILTQKLKKINTNSDISLEVSYDKTTELLTFKTGTLLEKDQKYLLTITYSGELRKDKKGFYLAEYLYNGKQQVFSFYCITNLVDFIFFSRKPSKTCKNPSFHCSIHDREKTLVFTVSH